MTNPIRFCGFASLALATLAASTSASANDAAQGPKKKIVLIAGNPSHGFGEHAHDGGCKLLAKWLNENVAGAKAVVYTGGWPRDPHALAGAATVVIYSDGGRGHPILQHLDEMANLAARGVGLACIHYAVEVPKGEPADQFRAWIGGCFETYWSVNPFWRASFQEFPKHPVANGLRPFSIADEWYYHMRFANDMKGVTPILTAVPPDSTHRPVNEPYAGNPTVFARKGMPEHVAWVYQRPDGGRGFGFTGGHHHWNWGCDNFRKTVLNGIVWTAKLDIPPDGIASKRPTVDELLGVLSQAEPKHFDRLRIAKMIEEANR